MTSPTSLAQRESERPLTHLAGSQRAQIETCCQVSVRHRHETFGPLISVKHVPTHREAVWLLGEAWQQTSPVDPLPGGRFG